MPKWRIVDDIRIGFNADRAVFSCARQLDLAAVRTELEAACDFIEHWIDAAEPPKPRSPTPEEVEMRNMLLNLARGLRRLKWEKEWIADAVQAIAEKVGGQRWPTMPADNRDRVVRDVIATL